MDREVGLVSGFCDGGVVAIDASTALRRAHEWLVVEPPQVVETPAGRHVGEAFTRTVEGRVAQLRRLDDAGNHPVAANLISTLSYQ